MTPSPSPGSVPPATGPAGPVEPAGPARPVDGTARVDPPATRTPSIH